MKKILLMAAAAVLAIGFTACGNKSQAAGEDATETTETAEATPQGVVLLEDDNLFRPGQAVNAPTVLDFNATWCIPCKKLTPAFDKAAEAFAGNVAFYSVDIDKNTATAEAFGIEAVPTVIIIAPDGSSRTFVGLDDFVGEADINDPNLTDIILANMTSLINEAL